MLRLSTLVCVPVSIWLSCAAARAPQPVAGPAGALSALSYPGAGNPVAVPTDKSFVSLEGPYWVAAGSYLIFSDVVEANGPGALIYRFDPGSRQFTVVPYPITPAAPAAQPTSTNGLAVDSTGNLLACERYNARLVRVGTDGKLAVLADGWPTGADPTSPARRAFNAPNDLAVRGDGTVYFTDSDWGARPGTAQARMGVYRLSPRGDLTRVMDLDKPNGIALSPDEATLYVGSDVQAKVWRLPLDSAGVPGAATLFIDGARVPGGFKVPDGICVDDAGNLYVTNNADDVSAIVVFDKTGQSLGRIAFPHAPSNCTFGGADRRTLYVTTLHALYEVRMPVAGRP
ncbi:MAG: SMP-30/gluconolactonase/LRE family protein [Deltaproteobacteria bacterium]|nr:SMP-30/gluconolactonase/LRE family protein [Deltaproteobacteria bacterium]